MFDCGEGTQIQLMKSSLKAGKVNRIFITHLHGDHLYGISGLMCTIGQTNQRDAPILIYGPLGLAKYLRVTLGLSRANLAYRFKVIELVPTVDMRGEEDDMCNFEEDDHLKLHPCEDEGERIEAKMVNGVPRWPIFEGPLTVTAGKLEHRIASFAFIIQEQTIPGNLNVYKLRSFGIEPGPVCKLLRNGNTVSSPSGQQITLKDVLGDDQPGRKVVICGDSMNSSHISYLAQNADVYIHEATLENELKDQAIERGHSTPEMAAEFALQANAKLLYLTHFSQRYTESRSQQEKTIYSLLEQAKLTFGPNCAVAEDLQTYSVKQQSSRTALS